MEIQRYVLGHGVIFESDSGNYVKHKDFEESQRVLKQCFTDVVWMAVRYAHGRSTYAPDMVRSAIFNFRKIFPDWELRKDITIEPPGELGMPELRSDYLDDLMAK